MTYKHTDVQTSKCVNTLNISCISKIKHAFTCIDVETFKLGQRSGKAEDEIESVVL